MPIPWVYDSLRGYVCPTCQKLRHDLEGFRAQMQATALLALWVEATEQAVQDASEPSLRALRIDTQRYLAEERQP